MKRIVLLSGLIVIGTAAYLVGELSERQRLNARQRAVAPQPQLACKAVDLTALPASERSAAVLVAENPPTAAPGPVGSLPALPVFAQNGGLDAERDIDYLYGAGQSHPLSGAGAVNNLTPIQRRFLDLSEKKARVLKEDQLQQAIGDLEREVEGLDASARLNEAVKILQEVADKHYQTDAGRAAIAGLAAINQKRQQRVLPQQASPTPEPVSTAPTFNPPSPTPRSRKEFDTK